MIVKLKPPASRLIESKATTVAGREVTASRYSTPNRRTGCRIIVTSEEGADLFDTEDCYDVSNAIAKLGDWIREEEFNGTCAHCAEAIPPEAERAQDAESGKPICAECVAKAVPSECPF